MTKLEQYGLSVAKIIITAALCLFGLLSMLFVYFNNGATFDYFYCLATIPFGCLPLLLSIIFKWRFNILAYIIFSFYTLGPILGAVYDLYYLTSWWDDLLHILAGAMFAIVGAYMAKALNKNKDTSYLLCALFGLCFSMAIAVLWEIYEFSSDWFLHSDMQADTIVHTVATKMGLADGSLNLYENITDISINGQALNIGGYLDIGLVDTMRDMTVETIGAAVYIIYALIDRDRHPLIKSCRK